MRTALAAALFAAASPVWAARRQLPAPARATTGPAALLRQAEPIPALAVSVMASEERALTPAAETPLAETDQPSADAAQGVSLESSASGEAREPGQALSLAELSARFDGAAFKLSDEEVPGLARLVNETLARFPPSSHFVLGLGRSPTPLIAALQNHLHDGYASSLPLTKFRHRLTGEDSREWYGPLKPDAEAALFAHFDRFLPSAATIAGRTIIVADFVERGTTLMSGVEYLNKWAASRGRSERFAAYPFGARRDVRRFERNARADGVPFVSGSVLSRYGSFAGSVADKVYPKSFAEYGGFQLGRTDGAKLAPMARYDRLRLAIGPVSAPPERSRLRKLLGL